MFTQETLAAIKHHAGRLGVEAAALAAVVEVESGGRVYAIVGDRRQPLIRFEGHYFYRRLTGEARARAVTEGLADPNAGVVKNPPSQAARWRVLERAILIDAAAALESTSWGVGQVMGAHWSWLGFDSVDELVNTARRSVFGQITLMCRYIDKAGLADALKRRDWASFARGYNGPAFQKLGYHTKLAASYRRYPGKSPAVLSAEGMLRLGSKGARVRELQALLVRAGQSLKVDGDFGPATHQTVRAFQQVAGLTVDGVAGPETLAALDRFRQGAGDRPGDVGPMELPEAKTGVGGLAGGAVLEAARLQLDQAADRLAFVPGLEWLSAGLAVVSVLLVLGGLALWARGWLKSRQTVEAPA
ncbi:N-acetylmuramidase domain-containing protein [Chelativorans alearense]|uniref:N-acetylmuramidase domain-containing protein n=1 Tax=Chelativorans alearense TaxID=2681495 RepID=UPI0013D08775|nr:N-acetylmuramidase domain-containing protein [Chelativorans alearense]